MASLVASVILFSRRLRTVLARGGAERGDAVFAYGGPEAIFPAGIDNDGGGVAASRQPTTAASRAAGLNGFCRLLTAPSLVAIVRKFGPESAVTGLPEITMIGISGCC